MTINTAWLKEVCSKDPGRPDLLEPMTVSLGGKDYTVAADGHRLVELPGILGPYGQPSAKISGPLEKLLAPTHGDAVPFSFKALAEFIELHMRNVVPECKACHGMGEIMVRGRPKICTGCGGAVAYPKKIFIADVLFNARLFEVFIRNLPHSTIASWHQASRTLAATIDGGSWRVRVMPLREDRDPRGNRYQLDLPSFEIPGVKRLAA